MSGSYLTLRLLRMRISVQGPHLVEVEGLALCRVLGRPLSVLAVVGGVDVLGLLVYLVPAFPVNRPCALR